MISKLDHVTIRTRDISATRKFFVHVFGMSPGERPAMTRRIPGCWLYSDGRPLVHIIASFGVGMDRAAEAIDHLGFRLDGYSAFRTKLDLLGIRYSKMDLTRTPCVARSTAGSGRVTPSTPSSISMRSFATRTTSHGSTPLSIPATIFIPVMRAIEGWQTP